MSGSYGYGASIIECVKQFTEEASACIFACRTEFSISQAYKKAGRLGEGKIAVSFESIEATSDMVGLSAAFS